MTADIIKFTRTEKSSGEQSTSQTHVTLPEKEEFSGGRAEDRISTAQLQSMLRRLVAVFDESKEPGWDGESAEAVSEAAFYNATKLISTLPVSLPTPDIVADNDGYIEFEWYKGRKNFSLYVTDTNLVLYAGFYGKDDRLSGRFVYEGIFPNLVETLAKDVYREEIQ